MLFSAVYLTKTYPQAFLLDLADMFFYISFFMLSSLYHTAFFMLCFECIPAPFWSAAYLHTKRIQRELIGIYSCSVPEVLLQDCKSSKITRLTALQYFLADHHKCFPLPFVF